MRLYWEVARRGYRQFAAYRAATAAGVFTNTVFGFMRAYVFIALFAARPDVGGYDLVQTLTYTFLSQGILMPVYLWGWWPIALTIRSGDVVTDLYRPLDYQFYWMAQDLGRATYHALYRGIPPFVLGALVFDLRLPQQPLTWLAFPLSVALAVCVSFAVRFMLNLSAFWLLDYRGVGAIAAAAYTFLSGFVIPVAFFPAWLQAIAWALPFPAYVAVPIEVFLEKRAGPELLGALGYQAMWAGVLLAAGRLMLRAATRKVVVQGG